METCESEDWEKKVRGLFEFLKQKTTLQPEELSLQWQLQKYSQEFLSTWKKVLVLSALFLIKSVLKARFSTQLS